jgi:hypothetical protein
MNTGDLTGTEWYAPWEFTRITGCCVAHDNHTLVTLNTTVNSHIRKGLRLEDPHVRVDVVHNRRILDACGLEAQQQVGKHCSRDKVLGRSSHAVL